jgi:hypothetical protein
MDAACNAIACHTASKTNRKERRETQVNGERREGKAVVFSALSNYFFSAYSAVIIIGSDNGNTNSRAGFPWLG